MRKYVFVVGVGRSGTSLVQSMIGSNTNISMLPESGFVRKYVIPYEKITEKLLDEISRDPKVNRIVSSHALEMMAQKGGSTLELYNLIHKLNSTDDEAIFGDKDPRMLDYMGHLHEILPHAKILHIIRDPRDVVLSRIRAKWVSKTPFFIHASLYNAQICLAQRNAELLSDGVCMEVKYEELLDNPENILRKICVFIGADYQRDMATFFSLEARKLVTDNEYQWKKETLGPLLNKNKDKWMSELSVFEIKLVERICSYVFKNGYYSVHTAKEKNLSLFDCIRISMCGALSFVFEKIYRFRVLMKK